jgi:hypothetical protein
MYQKTILTLLLGTLAFGATAQVKLVGKKSAAVKTAPAVAAKAASVQEVKPTGPAGFGPVKIDMSKDELEALTASDGVYLSGALTPKEEKYGKPPEGTVRFEGQMMIPLSSSPVKASFTFQDNKLRYFSMELHEIIFDFAQKQIAEKYGTGEVKDEQKEEQCIYKNGSNFKLINGTKEVIWHQAISSTDQITTSATDMQIARCPSSLRDPMFSVKTKWISFERGPIKTENKKNLF